MPAIPGGHPLCKEAQVPRSTGMCESGPPDGLWPPCGAALRAVQKRIHALL